MRNLLSIFTLVFILLNSTASWGEVDEKGLICQCEKCDIYHLERGYWFEDGKVKPRLFGEQKDKVTTFERPGLLFTTTSDEILWWETFEFKLDRETLTLDTFSQGELKTRSNCEVFDKEGFQKTWDILSRVHQISLNQKLTKNKI